jgi:hypothetical protein
MTITGTIEQAPKDQYYMTDASKGDIMFRSLCNISWMFGAGSNTSSLFKINENRTTLSTPTVVISSSVGIVCGNPQYELDVTGDINFTGNLLKGGIVYSPSPWLSNVTNPNAYFTNGFVGIGKSNPQYTLDVTGNIASDTMYTSNINSYGAGLSNTLNIGTDSNAATINIGGANSTINLAGFLSVLSTTDLYVDDRKITLNYGGAATTGNDSGFEIQEDGAVTGYIKTSSDRNSFLLRTPAGVSDMTMDLSKNSVNINSSTLVLSNTNVGIGKGAHATYKLDVNGTVNASVLSLTGTSGAALHMVSALDSTLTNGQSRVFGLGKAGTANNRAEITYNHVGDGLATNYLAMGLYGNNTTFNITGGGSVGIGTNSPGTAKLAVSNTGGKKLQFVNDYTSHRHVVLYENADNEHQFSGIGIDVGIFRNQLSASTGSYTWNAAASATASTELMRLTGDGKLGIGKTGAYPLDVNGIANVSDKLYVTNNIGLGTTTTSEKLHISAGNIAIVHGGAYNGFASADKWISIGDKSLATAPQFQMSNYGMSVTWDSDGCFFGLRDYGTNRKDTVISYGDDAAENLIFMTKSNSELMRLSGSGQLGIGKSNPAYPLDVNGSINATSLLINGEALSVNVGGGFTSTPTNITYTTCNVGIGTNAPNASYKLDVNGSINASGSINANNLLINGAPLSVNVGGGFTTGATNTTSTTCNVGIGKTPSYPLDVNGIINAAALYVAGAPYIGSQWTTNSTSNCISITSCNIGINTTTPQRALHIVGDIQVDSNLYLGNRQFQMQGLLITKRVAGSGVANMASVVSSISGITYDSNIILASLNSNFDVILKSGNTEIMRCTGTNNNVGIGSSAPTTKLDVAGDSFITGTLQMGNVNGSFLNGSGLTGYFDGSLVITSRANQSGEGIRFRQSNVDYPQFDKELMFIDGVNGNIGIGTLTPSYPLHVEGAIFATADVFAYSDSRYKHDLSQITDSVNKLKNLTGYTFNTDEDDIRHTGLLAQDVENVLPEAVTTTNDGRLGLAYGNLAGLFVEAFKEIDLRLSRLESKFGL